MFESIHFIKKNIFYIIPIVTNKTQNHFKLKYVIKTK